MTMTAEVQAGQLAELLKQVQAGNEIVLTQDQKPVAKIVAAEPPRPNLPSTFQVRSFRGHKVLTPNFSHAEIADEMFGQK